MPLRCPIVPAFALTCLILLPGTGATAGPWPREEGGGFLSISREVIDDPNGTGRYRERSTSSVYGEYGLSDRTTLVLDAVRATDDRTLLVLLRRMLTENSDRRQVAVSFGGGQRITSSERKTVTAVGLHLGHGLKTRFGPGWTSIDTQYRRRSNGEEVVKSDVTLGVRPSDNWLVFGQFQADNYPGADTSMRLQASVVRRMNKRFRVEASVITGLHNSDVAGFKLGLWSEF